MKTLKKSTKHSCNAMEKSDVWAHSKWFRPSENWGNPYVIKKDLLDKLNELRSILMVPIHVNSGTQGIHAKRSAHYDGYAADVVIPGLDMHPFDLFVLMVKLGFRGIGYYPEWQHGGKIIGGWHLDMSHERVAYWVGYHIKGKFQYKNMSFKALSDLGFFKPST